MHRTLAGMSMLMRTRMSALRETKSPLVYIGKNQVFLMKNRIFERDLILYTLKSGLHKTLTGMSALQQVKLLTLIIILLIIFRFFVLGFC